jgi:tetratricopeptide (TPR) repeat protein
MTPRQVRTSLELMRQSPDIALNDSLARELALREGVKAFVTGSLVRLAGSFTITVQLVAAHSGEALAAVRENAPDTSQIIVAVDRASKALRHRIGESLRDLERMPTLEQATTASLPALRFYTEGSRLVRQGKRSDAVSRFEQAVELDPGFAAAYLSLSMVHGSLGDEGRANAAARKAIDHQDRLTFLERGFLLGSRAYAAQDYPTAIRVYTELAGRYPDNIPAINNLALAYQDSRQFAVAESLFRRALALDSSIANLLFGVHGSQVLQGKFAEASATLNTIARRFPGHPVYLVEALQDAAAQQDWSRAEQVAWTTIREAGTDTVRLLDPHEALAGIAMTRGRLSEAERLWKIQLAMSRQQGMMGRHLFGILQLGWLRLRHRGDTAGAVALVDSALRVTPLDSLLPGDRKYDDVARFYLAAGQRARVAPLLKAAAANDSVLRRTPAGDRLWTRGVQALAEARVPEAIELLRQAADQTYCTNCVFPDLGRAFEAAGQSREAAAAYQRYVTTPWLLRYEPDAVELGWTLSRLGGLSERLGDTAGARAAWERLRDLWQEADPVLQPAVEAARAGLRRP